MQAIKRCLILGAAMFAAALPCAAVDHAEVAANYAEIVDASYQDSLAGAHALKAAIEAFAAAPSELTLSAARQAWLTSARDVRPNGSLPILCRADRR